MATQKCLDNIKSWYPGFPPCTDSFCQSISFINDKHCTQRKPPLSPDDPIGPSVDPALGDYCYCCCSCFGSYTPIEVSAGEYALARDIKQGETILAAGADLAWAPRVVEAASTWEEPGMDVPGMYFLRYRYGDPDGIRDVMVSPDHLFLTEDGTLVAVQDLTKEPIRLRRADGGLSEVVVLAQGTYQGGVTSIQMEGGFDGHDLRGHLLNTNGLVSADFKVQVYYSSQNLAGHLTRQFSPEKEGRPAGTPEYHEQFPDEAYARFISDPASWPEGFTPARATEIRIPETAARYLTREQARDIRRHAPMESAGNTYPARAVLYLFNLLRGLYPDIDFILDWENALPNAYGWAQWGRRTVVITGGMARLKDLRRDGLAIVVSAMVAYQFPDVRCVGEADYSAIALVMHDLWDGDLFVSVLRSGLPAIEKIFSYISPDHAQRDPGNPCKVPGIACRLDSYNAGRSSFPVPECAQPKPAYFEVRDARALSPDTVQIAFSRTLNVPTAESAENYEFEPDTNVRSAAVNPDQPATVVLQVGELAPGTSYLVHVSNVVSNDDVPLDPARSTGAFTAK